MSRVQYNRTPCPGRVFDDLGNGFAMGCFGGSLLYFVKGKLSHYNLQAPGTLPKSKESFLACAMLEIGHLTSEAISACGEASSAPLSACSFTTDKLTINTTRWLRGSSRVVS